MSFPNDPLIDAVAKILAEEAFVIVESAEGIPDKLIRDAQSLKKTGWKMDRIKQHLLTHGDYGVKLNSAMIDSIFEKPKSAPKEKPFKAPKWKTPTGPKGDKQKNDERHAETFAAGWSHPDARAEGGGDLGYGELWDVMSQAGYTDDAMKKALSNLGLADDRRRPAKKRPKSQND